MLTTTAIQSCLDMVKNILSLPAPSSSQIVPFHSEKNSKLKCLKTNLKKNPVVADPFTAELPPVLYQKGRILLF